MFRLTTLVLAVLFPVFLLSCAPRSGSGGSSEVLTSFFPMQVFTMNVTRGIPELAPVLMIPPALGCPHDYTLTTGDMEKIRKARILVVNGIMEEFLLPEKIRSVNSNLTVINSGRNVDLIKEHDEHGHKNHHHQYNPHLWVSPFVAAQQVRAVGRELAAVYPRHSRVLLRNADEYARKLEALGREMKAAVSKMPNRKIMTFHNAFDYLARDIGLEVIGVLEVEPGVNPGPRHLKNMADLARKHGLKAVFAETQYPQDVADLVAREAGIRIAVLDPASSGDSANVDAYETVMRGNLAVLTGALKQ